MNGRTHAGIGAASIAGAALSGVSPVDCAVMALISAGFALGPDIDHPGSTITRSMPKAVHRTFHRLAHTARVTTATGGDRSHFAWKASQGHDPEHRTLTHTILAGAVVTAGASGVAVLPVGGLILTVMAVWWCHKLTKGLWSFLMAGIVIAAISPPEAHLVAWAAGVGWLSHIIADGCTKSGVPMMWPAKIKGRRWYRFRILGSVLPSGHRLDWIAGLGVAALMNSPLLLM